MECPKCKRKVRYVPGEDEFCPECGAELASAAAAQAEQAEKKQRDTPEAVLPGRPAANSVSSGRLAANSVFPDTSSIPPFISGSEIDGTDVSISRTPVRRVQHTQAGSESPQRGKVAPEHNSLAGQALKIAKNIDSADDVPMMEFSTEMQSDCLSLEVAHNRNVFFLSGSESIMKLRLTPRDSRLHHIMVFMEIKRSGNNICREIPVRDIPRVGQPICLLIPFLPERVSGSLAFAYYIGVQIDHKMHYYQFQVQHRVYDSNQSSESLRQEIKINIHNEASEAGGNTNNVVLKALDNLAGVPSTHELIDRLNDLPVDYVQQSLTMINFRPEEVLALVKGNPYIADRLILEWNGFSILLIAKKDVKFGRDPGKVDLIVRVGGGKIGPNELPNISVSGLHTEVLYEEDTVKLFDRSKFGTYINGLKPDGIGMQLPDSAVIEFGNIHWKMNIQRCEMRSPGKICKTCGAHKIKSITFTRKDQEKECYLLVWQCCELGRVIEELADWSVFFRHGAFFIRTPEQEFFFLRPGHWIESGGETIRVRYFKQN